MNSRFSSYTALACAFFICLAAITAGPMHAAAQSAEQLQQQIADNNAQIEALNKEIAQYQAQLNSTTAQKNTLQNKINQLDLQRKQLLAKVNATKTQINSTQLQIQQIAGSIASKEGTIDGYRSSLGESIRLLHEADQRSLAVSILSSGSITEAWEDTETISLLQGAVQDTIGKLLEQKQQLSETKTAAEEKRTQLVKQQQTLASQQGSLDATRKAQSELLSETKSKESSYQQILAQKQAEKKQFENAIFELSSKLQYVRDPSKVPPAGKGVLSWPLDNVFVTQQFGKTSSSGRLYASGTHNGVDFRASIGTPVRAALSGTVQEINLGVAPNCQYGKWVLIKHGNGLTSLYAHLSDVKVSKGSAVGTGDVIGYAGDTGYATGPHLHLTLFLSDAVQFKNYTCNSGKTTFIPISAPNGYLDPLAYL